MKKEHAFLYGGFFAFLPRVRGFLLETVFPERAVCRTCGRITGGGILCGGCRSRLLSDGMTMAWDREELEPDLDAYILRPHTGVARQLVLRLKHSAEKCLADELADLQADKQGSQGIFLAEIREIRDTYSVPSAFAAYSALI